MTFQDSMFGETRGRAAVQQPLQERAYKVLKEAIVSCKMPPGSIISEDALVEKFRTSRTPIREALLRLQKEGFVEIFPHQGTFVSQISLKDIYEIYQFRLIIESQMIKISRRNLEKTVLERFRNFFIEFETREFSIAEWVKTDRDMHCYIVEASGNDYLRGIYATIMDLIQRMRITSGKMPHRMKETNREHVIILDALLAGEDDKAAELMAAHITSSRDAVLELEDFYREGSGL
jgi:DNA-binding GntR family transcriptional regulator